VRDENSEFSSSVLKGDRDLELASCRNLVPLYGCTRPKFLGITAVALIGDHSQVRSSYC